jgi:hypothetical protein
MPPENASAVNAEILRVATQLDKILDELGESVAELTAILRRPVSPPSEADERLIAP